MASSMIHYVISKIVAELAGIEDVERFLLGAVVAPDASSRADGSYDKAHFQGWLQNRTMKGIDFNRFADKYGECFNEDAFYLGYWCHLMESVIESVKGYFVAELCKKEELELYTWEVITSYIDKCVHFCAEEIETWRTGKENRQAEQYYVNA